MPRPIHTARDELANLVAGLHVCECDGHPMSHERNLDAIRKLKAGLDRFFEVLGRESECDGVNVDLVDYRHITDGLADDLVAGISEFVENAYAEAGTYTDMRRWGGC